MARKGSRKRLNKRGGNGKNEPVVAPAEENMFSKFTGELKGKVADNIQLKVDELKENTANHAKALKEEADKMKGNITGITSGITGNMAKIFSKPPPPPAGGRRRRSTKRKTAKRSSSKRSSSKRSRSRRSRKNKRKTNKRKRVRFSMRSRSKRH